MAEGHKTFAVTLTAINEAGQTVEKYMLFVWYLLEREQNKTLNQSAHQFDVHANRRPQKEDGAS